MRKCEAKGDTNSRHKLRHNSQDYQPEYQQPPEEIHGI